MKKNIFTIALFLGLQLSLTAVAQQSEIALQRHTLKERTPHTQREKVTLRVPDFARPLVEKWVEEYQKTNMEADFQFISGKSQNTENSLALTTDNSAVLVARYAVLPVTTRGSEAEHLVGGHALNAKKLKQLFFVNDDLDDERKEGKLEQRLHIVTGNSPLSASRLYAKKFHQETVNYKGKKISGDDSYLNLAISRDPLSVTVNSLSNIFDMESRQLRQTLALLPLDTDKQGRQVLSGGSLDDILQLLENKHYDEIAVGDIGFEYNRANSVLTSFVQWVLQNGTQYVHQYGLLQLSQQELLAQLRRTVQHELAQK